MEVRELEAIKGTKYEVVVTRDSGGDYAVEVRKPGHSNDPFVTMETVALRYLEGNSSEQELNRLVREIIETDHPSLVGTYADSKETNGYQHEYS